MLDRFDRQLLNLVQRDDSRTADSLAEEVPLSPSAIARRLRRLRGGGWIAAKKGSATSPAGKTERGR
jgi:DNA-binding Lrp family transcriptional regulator